jgi:hypothetical protein
MRFFPVLLVVLAFADAALGSEVITLDPRSPPTAPPAAIEAVVIDENTGAQCGLRLEPNGRVRDAHACPLGERLRRVIRWARAGDVVLFYDASGKCVLAFNAIADGVFRATGENLTLHLLPLRSIPLTH